MKLLDQYVKDVLAGKIVTGKLVRLACERHRDDLKDPRLVWNEERAQHACKHFLTLKHYRGKWAGMPFTLEPWQAFIIGSIFGWYRIDGYRRFKEAYVEIARKNGKTLLAAGVATYLFLCDGEAAPQVFSVATKEQQAKIVHDDARFMIEASPRLRGLVKIKHNTLEADGGRSYFKPLGRDSKTQDGLNPHGAIGDEVHAWADRRMYDVITSAFGAREQPVFLNITTAGLATDCFCYDYRTACVNMLKGYKEGYDQQSLFSYIACMDEDDDVEDESNWIKANPNLGVSVKLSHIQDEANKARLMPSHKHGFLTKSLNIWVDSAEGWFDLEWWDKCKTVINWDAMRGAPCFGGLDLASNTDFAALCWLFPEGNKYKLLLRLWIPEETLKTQTKLRDRRVLDRICKWRDEGWVFTPPGNALDYDYIQKQISEDAKNFDVREIGFDPYNSGNLPSKLQDIGLNMTAITQGHRTLGGPTKDFESLVLSGHMIHDGNPVMRWMLGNVVLVGDMYGNNRPDKKKCHEKIDGVIAALMSLQRATHGEAPVVPGFAFL